MIQFFGTVPAVFGMEADVNVVDCPGENDIHPFDPT
jgi:hypothetical protein